MRWGSKPHLFLSEMHMFRKITSFVLLLCLGLSVQAQSPIYLFPEFTAGSVALKNRTFVKTTFNYDTFHDKLLYMDGEEVMELSDFSNVASVFIGERTFVPQGRLLYEVVDLGDSPDKLLIRWHQKKNPMGKKGAYGQVAEGTGAVSLDPEYYSISLKSRSGEQVFDTVVENNYGLLMAGKFKKFKDRKSFLKLFPEKKERIEKYIKKEHILFTNPDHVIAVARFAVAQ